MKTNKLIHLIMLCALCSSNFLFAQENKIGSVDIKKIRNNKYTKFVDHVFWYSKEVINKKTISKNLIPEDMNQLKCILKKVIKPEYMLSEKFIDSNSIAVENLRDANDYILLEHKCNKYKIQIQEGKALYIGIFPNKDFKIEQSILTEYIKSVALQIFNLPEFDEEEQEPYVFTSILDIGGSKCGRLYYKASFPPPKFWYSSIKWWSDGKNILFMFGKRSFYEDLSKRAGPPKNLKAPRKFKKNGD